MSFEEKYEFFAEARADIFEYRDEIDAVHLPKETRKTAMHILNLAEKIISFGKYEYECRIEPAYAHEATDVREEADEEEKCLHALYMMIMEVCDDFCNSCYVKNAKAGPEALSVPITEFAKTPELSDVLKADDIEGKLARLEWLVDHFHDDENAKRYQVKREEWMEKQFGAQELQTNN